MNILHKIPKKVLNRIIKPSNIMAGLNSNILYAEWLVKNSHYENGTLIIDKQDIFHIFYLNNCELHFKIETLIFKACKISGHFMSLRKTSVATLIFDGSFMYSHEMLDIALDSCTKEVIFKNMTIDGFEWIRGKTQDDFEHNKVNVIFDNCTLIKFNDFNYGWLKKLSSYDIKSNCTYEFTK